MRRGLRLKNGSFSFVKRRMERILEFTVEYISSGVSSLGHPQVAEYAVKGTYDLRYSPLFAAIAIGCGGRLVTVAA